MSNRFGGSQMQWQMPLTKTVKNLIIINVFIWLVLQVILERFFLPQMHLVQNFGLVPYSATFQLKLWQLFTYMFLHGLDVMHIIFNMLLLWMLGSELEQKWGSRFFLAYYLVCGVGAAVLYSLGSLVYGLLSNDFGLEVTPLIGASGALFGLLLAYGIVFGERMVYFMFLFPLKAKHFVSLLGAIEVLMILTNSQKGVSNLAHICGLIVGYIFLLIWTKRQQWKRRKINTLVNRPKLKLVVDNDSPSSDTGSKYWN